MKAVFLASLICVSTVACAMELPEGFAEGLETMQRVLQDAVNAPESRKFKPNAASCPWTCQETDFFLPAVQALTTCTAARTALQVGLASATNSSTIDNTWTTFCGSSCFTAAQQIQEKYYCCLGEAGGAFFGLNKGCAKNPNTNRYCGAELLNIGGVKCLGTTQANCVGSGLSCEWDSTNSRCAFKPVAAVLDGICSPCIREFIEIFPSGGIDTAASRNSLVAAYTTYCTKIQGNYCAITGGYDYQYRKPDLLTNAELTDLCSDSDASVKKRLCYKQVQASTAASLRNGIQSGYAACIVTGYTPAQCIAQSGTYAGLSTALDRMANLMCTKNPANSYCLATETQANLATPCAAALIANNTCTGACPTTLTATANTLGCCMGALANSGSVATASINTMGRSLSDNRALLLGGVLNRTASVPFINEATFNQITNVATIADTLMASSPFSRFTTCGIALVNDSSLTSMSTSCYNPMSASTVKLTIHLNVTAAGIMNTSVMGFAKEELIMDLANRLGVTRASVTDVSFVPDAARAISATGVTGVTPANVVVTLNIDSPAEVAMLKLEVAAQIAARSLSLPLLATELAVNCPACLSNTYSTIVDGTEVSSTTTITTTTTPAPAGPTSGAASHTLMVAATALIALVVAMI